MPESGPSKHILVVDDTKDILELFREIIESLGHRVTAEIFTPEDLAKVIEIGPDLAILDLRMGVDSAPGWALVQKMKMSRETEAIPIIVCSAAINEVRAVRARWILGPGGLLDNHPRSVPADWIGEVIVDVLRAQARLRPAVRQSRLSVFLDRVGGLTVIPGFPYRINNPSRGELPPEWSADTLTLTEEPHAGRTREAIVRRLWRAAGADVPEPDDLAE